MSSAVPPVPWHEFAQDPRTPQAAPLRAWHRDHAVVEDVLAEAYADGRLTRKALIGFVVPTITCWVIWVATSRVRRRRAPEAGGPEAAALPAEDEDEDDAIESYRQHPHRHDHRRR